MVQIALELNDQARAKEPTYSDSPISTPNLTNEDSTELEERRESIISVSPPCEMEDIECTDGELERIEQTAETLTRERAQKESFIREIEQIRNNLHKVMESKLPIKMKIKLMESMNELLRTKMSCIKEANKDVKERILRLERINNYVVSLRMVSEWQKSGKLVAEIPKEVVRQMHDSYISCVFAEDSSSDGELSEENEDDYKQMLKFRSTTYKLEEMVILLKQVAIPVTISKENLRDDLDGFLGLMQQRKRVLEEKLRAVEELKRKFSNTDITESDKAYISPPAKAYHRKGKGKLRNMILGYEEKTQDLSSSRSYSRSNIGTPTNTSVLKEASSKISKVLGSIFKPKKKAPDTIFTAEVIKDLDLRCE